MAVGGYEWIVDCEAYRGETICEFSQVTEQENTFFSSFYFFV